MTINKMLNTGASEVVRECQVCGNPILNQIIFLGYLPPVNKMVPIGERASEQQSYPAELLYCKNCNLVQLGLIVDPAIIFPESYPYTSSTTKILRDNFAELYSECTSLISLGATDLIVDIGSNDGNLLSNFKDNHRVVGITPEKIGEVAVQKGIPTIFNYFGKSVVQEIIRDYGHAKIITATNVFAHIEDVNSAVVSVLELLQPDGIFITESHYLYSLLNTLQYDTIYHEHLRYYSLHSLSFLLKQHGLEVFHAKEIPTHGGSIRVSAARTGQYPINQSVDNILKQELKIVEDDTEYKKFKESVVLSKTSLISLINEIKNKGARICGISAPSRASTLINYVGLDDGIIDYVLEVPGSHKIGNYIPGTLIPIVEEKVLFEEQPEYALLLSWHIADELIGKLRNKGYKGKFIIPLPIPKIISD